MNEDLKLGIIILSCLVSGMILPLAFLPGASVSWKVFVIIIWLIAMSFIPLKILWEPGKRKKRKRRKRKKSDEIYVQPVQPVDWKSGMRAESLLSNNVQAELDKTKSKKKIKHELKSKKKKIKKMDQLDIMKEVIEEIKKKNTKEEN